MKNYSVILYGLLVVIADSKPAFAYLDAGSGSMLVQLILGGVAGLAVFLKVFWHSLLAKFGIRKRDTEKIGTES